MSHEHCEKHDCDATIDTMNKFGVAGIGGQICFCLPITVARRFSADEALNLAAWLVALAEPDASHSFEDVLDAIRAT